MEIQKTPTDHEVSHVIPPGIEVSQASFRRELPELLKLKNLLKQWVAYCGEARIGFGQTKTELFQECLRRGLPRGTFVVRLIQPESPREMDDIPNV